MPILTLLTQVKLKRRERRHPFIDSNAAMRRSYLTGVAMQAYADGSLDAREEALFIEMAAAFDVGETEARDILNRALSSNQATISELRDQLVDSKFKYYFILDLQIMAQQDDVVTAEEKGVIKRFAEILEIEPADFLFLRQLAEAVLEEDPSAKASWAANFFRKSHLWRHTNPEDFTFYTE